MDKAGAKEIVYSWILNDELTRAGMNDIIVAHENIHVRMYCLEHYSTLVNHINLVNQLKRRSAGRNRRGV